MPSLACGLVAMACGAAMPAPVGPSATTDQDPTRASRTEADPRSTSPAGFPRTPFPLSVSGLAFGSALTDFREWCVANAGNVVALEHITACHSLRLPDFPLRIDTVIPTLCEGRLCRVSFNTTRPPPTPTETLAAIFALERAFGPGLSSSDEVPCPGYSSGRYWLWGDRINLWSVSLDSTCRRAEDQPILSVIYSTPESYAKTPEDRPYI